VKLQHQRTSVTPICADMWARRLGARRLPRPPPPSVVLALGPHAAAPPGRHAAWPPLLAVSPDRPLHHGAAPPGSCPRLPLFLVCGGRRAGQRRRQHTSQIPHPSSGRREGRWAPGRRHRPAGRSTQPAAGSRAWPQEPNSRQAVRGGCPFVTLRLV
jgi:hypothetical protein